MQPSLFDAPVARGASRASDPATSRDAGRSMSGAVLRVQQRQVLRAVAWLGTATSYEVHRHLGYRVQQNVAVKRLGELRELGLVRETGATRPGSSKRSLLVFEATEDGRSAA